MRFLRTFAFVLVPAVLAVGAAQERARITRIEFRPATVDEGGGILISLLGSGNCTYVIDFGDGQRERRTAELPDQVRHAYAADNEYEVVATPEAPCEGVARAKVTVRAIQQGLWGLHAELASSTEPEIVLLVDGRGACPVLVDFGDGDSAVHELTLPAKIPHRYAKAGAYEIHAAAREPCRGEGRVRIEIKS